MRLNEEKANSIIYRFRRQFLKCKSPNDIDELREKLFNMYLGETVKEKLWDSICLGVEYRKRTKKELPIEDLIEDYNKHKSIYRLSEKYQVSHRTIWNKLKREGII